MAGGFREMVVGSSQLGGGGGHERQGQQRWNCRQGGGGTVGWVVLAAAGASGGGGRGWSEGQGRGGRGLEQRSLLASEVMPTSGRSVAGAEGGGERRGRVVEADGVGGDGRGWSGGPRRHRR